MCPSTTIPLGAREIVSLAEMKSVVPMTIGVPATIAGMSWTAV